MRDTGMDEAQTGIKIAVRNINNLRYADDTTLIAESEEELKGLLMQVKEENEKVGLKLNIQKPKIMISGSITSWQIDGETVETVADFNFLGSKITADGKIKRRLLLGRKVMINLDSMLKSRDSTLPTKVHLVKAMVFPVVMYGCESCTIRKSEHRRIDAFELWHWKRVLRVSWTARKSNQSILKEISPECSLEGLMLKLKVQYFGHLIRNIDSLERPWCWERLKTGGERDARGWDGWMASSSQWTWVCVNSGSGDGQGGLACCHPWGCKESDMTSIWTELNWTDRCMKVKECESRSVRSDSLRPRIIHIILQARIREWETFSFSRVSSQPRDQTQVSRIAGGFFTSLSHKGSPVLLDWVTYPFCSRSS